MALPADLHQHWDALSELLDEALTLPVEQRTAFVDALAGERALLREPLRALLAQSAGVETAEFLSTLPSFTPSAARGALADLAADDTIGPYRLERELGVGGMGSVWLAERADGSLKRKVALKLPRLAWVKGLAERMARERDILASLEHPHIARLYDAGLDQMGRPYLALEYVEGQPIDAYANERGLSVRHKLDLLLQVCAAVAFAHSRLVVHRDLKPSNILVTADGQVRLLDFGIAKLMEGDAAHETQLTQLAGRALTLDYASPEQIKGEPIGTTSDVYSLGVVTYELLTGAKPYKLQRGSTAALEEAIVTADVPAASSRVGSDTVRRALRGDLDAILNKALKKNPALRYATVDAMAQDIERHLNNEPVSAQPDALSYRMSKFVSRNRSAVIFSVLLLAVAVAGALATLNQYRQALVERDRAVSALERETAVSSFMQTLLGDIGTNRPMTGPELLTRSEALLSFEGLPPEHEVAVLQTIALLHSSHGNFSKAKPLIDRAAARAAEGQDRELQSKVRCAQASIAARTGPVNDAAATLEALAEEFADLPAAAFVCVNARAYIAQNTNDADAAIRFARRAIELERLAPQSVKSRALAIGSLGYGHSLAGNTDEALRLYAEAIEILRAAGLDESGSAVVIWNNWALASLAAGNPQQADTMFERVLETSRRHSPDASAPVFVLANRARTLLLLHRLDEALATGEFAAQTARKAGHLAGEMSAEVSRLEALRLREDFEAAARLRHDMEQRFSAKLPSTSPPMLGFARSKALLDADAGEIEGALAALDALVLALEAKNLRTSAFASLLLVRADIALRAGRLDVVESDVERALSIARAAQGAQPHSAVTGLALLQRARLHSARGRAAAAREDSAAAHAMLVPTLGAEHPDARAALRIASP